MGYSPLAQGAIVKDATIIEIAHKYNKQPAQVTVSICDVVDVAVEIKNSAACCLTI